MKKAIIIGAGPAGLTAAYQLLKETDIHPIIIEESEFIGGISRTAEYKGNRMDLGGHRFFSKNEQVNDIWKELMPLQVLRQRTTCCLAEKKPLAEGGPDPEQTDEVSLIRTRVSRIFFLRKFFDYPISMKPETFYQHGICPYNESRIRLSVFLRCQTQRKLFGGFLYQPFRQTALQHVF